MIRQADSPAGKNYKVLIGQTDKNLIK